MKKNIIISMILSVISMIALPLLVVFYIGGMDAMGILLLMLFTLNPIVSIIIGVLSGGKKVRWYLPVINAAIFLIAQSVITGFDIMYILAAVTYAGFGFAAAYIIKAVKNKKQAV
ncbi:MAG: hypothetical protein IJN56_04090 [Clostridia bacterium]|nr:hypothetical protein [Clostridia bacterium]